MEALRFCNTSVNIDDLHPIVRFLVASRICVIFMTIYAVSIGGLAALINGVFDIVTFSIIMILFILLHMADNLLNDLSDYGKRIDVEGYPRLQYAPHPVIHGILSVKTIKIYVVATLMASIIYAVYLGVVRTPLIPILALIGGFVMLGYSGIALDLKRSGLGELGVFIVWGLVMAGGTYTALTGAPPVREALVYMPYGLTVSLVLIGKHLDKYEMDVLKGVYTLPVRLGYGRTLLLARYISIAAPILAAIGISLYTGSPLSIFALSSLPMSYVVYKSYVSGMPSKRPEGWRIWPLWFAAWSYLSLDAVGRYTVLTLISVVTPYPYNFIAALLVILMLYSDIRKAREYISKYLS